MGSEEYFASIKDKLMTGAPKSKEWKEIHKICLTDATFKNREQIAKGYLNGDSWDSPSADTQEGGRQAHDTVQVRL